MPIDATDLFFILDEAYSLFSGSQGEYRYGGAGLQMFFLANELAKDEALNVTWVFHRRDLEGLSHKSIRFLSVDSIKETSSSESEKTHKVFTNPSKRVVISSIDGNAPFLHELAQLLNAYSILRISSDTSTTQPISDVYDSDELFDVYRALDGIVVQSETQRCQLQEKTGIESVAIPSMWPIQDCDDIEKSTILWVASSQYLKQPWHFIELAKQFKHERFAMILPKRDEQLFTYVQRRALAVPNLELVNSQLSPFETNAHFRKAKVLVNTSEFEGFPNTFLQAAAASTPILSFGVDPDGVLHSQHIGLTAEWRFENLCLQLERLLVDDMLRLTLGSNALHYVRRVHNPHAVAQQWKKFVKNIMEEKRVEG